MTGRGAFLGREEEVARLLTALEADRPVVVTVEAGVGKTRLVREALARSGRVQHEGGGFATLDWTPYLALERAVGPVTGDGARVARTVERRVGPDVLFMDDVQWVDGETRAVLELLGARVELVMGVRIGDPGTHRALALAERLRAERVDLDGLGEGDAMGLVRALRPDLVAFTVAGIVARAGGNPLYL